MFEIKFYSFLKEEDFSVIFYDFKEFIRRTLLRVMFLTYYNTRIEKPEGIEIFLSCST